MERERLLAVDIGSRLKRLVRDRIGTRIIPGVADLSDYLPIQEAAKVFKTSDDTLYRLLSAGKLTRYRRDHDLRTWLKRSELEAIFKIRPAED
jgi:excisionase family DNA binding protein